MSSSSSRRQGGRGRAQRMLLQPPEVHCIICQCPCIPGSDSGKLYKLLGCNHQHCGRCLTFNFNMAIRAKPFAPARCCSLTPSIDPETLKAGVEPAEVKKHMETYIAKLDEHNCKDKLFCHVKTCSAHIPMSRRSHRVGTCPNCACKTCKKCKSKSHWGACSAEKLKDLEGDKQLLALAQSRNWKQCPDCSAVVERMDGCPHMTCICGCEFCYNCGRTPFESHRCGAGAEVEVLDD
ncbi:hypothetical protein CONLIGDRAFT_393268 [Coniochaeta ligniaria NRRL 30616]|uniref:RBR-type E3 ubiquitin transferase n=1 Tax=Coniochaeta ligniaria NRRL 30616 TaxID=1408157 RepID=A0A1J7IML9_9PEZI|nr:hypothetical protein CONLIGDRAFT_393268 [Coniochaeta ligniaria NRRL 30616]